MWSGIFSPALTFRVSWTYLCASSFASPASRKISIVHSPAPRNDVSSVQSRASAVVMPPAYHAPSRVSRAATNIVSGVPARPTVFFHTVGIFAMNAKHSMFFP